MVPLFILLFRRFLMRKKMMPALCVAAGFKKVNWRGFEVALVCDDRDLC